MLTYGSLFTGIGGFDLGFDRAGMVGKWQVEKNKDCRSLLERVWPNVEKFDDATTCKPSPVDVVCGGDPCPKHSRARSNGESRHPDLSGYFLALVGRLQPRWVVRENVPAPTVDWFATGLGAIGYGVVVIRVDASKATGQSRQRDFIIGCHSRTTDAVYRTFRKNCKDGPGLYTTRFGTQQIVPALTTHRARYDSCDSYVFNADYGLRILESQEREALAGFPRGWTEGFPHGTRAKMLGNALIPASAQWIAERIIEIESLTSRCGGN